MAWTAPTSSHAGTTRHAEYKARCALWHQHFKGIGHALDMEAVPADIAELMRLYNEPTNEDGVWDRGADETDAEYAERVAYLDEVFLSLKALKILESLPSAPPEPGDEMPDGGRPQPDPDA